MNAAIIVAAGSSRRMDSGVDKLFLPLAGSPLALHAWRRFDRNALIEDVILVVRQDNLSKFEEFQQRYDFRLQARIVPGGEERRDSVWNGLQALREETDIVLIQDAARPATPDGLIERCIESARRHGAAVAASPVTDTIKETDDQGRAVLTLDRSRLRAVQTPQTFRKAVILEAMKEARRRGAAITDDTAACELIGHPVYFVESTEPNPKATTASDFIYLEALLKGSSSLAKTGNRA